MNKVQLLALLVVIGGYSTSARADVQGPWGTPEEAMKACATAIDSADCKAEIDRRAQECMKDPREAINRNGNEWFPKDPAKAAEQDLNFCKKAATNILTQQLDQAKAQDSAKAKATAEIEKREIPEAKKHDAKLEKMVADAFKKDYYPTVYRVILDERGWGSGDYEKDAFGRITGRDMYAWVVYKDDKGRCWVHNELWLQHGNGKSFSGPLKAEGGGSATDEEILCSKAEVAGKGGGGKKK